MADDRPVGIAVQRAVCAPGCTLPRELRHLLMVLAVLANRRTGRGIAGQQRIAEALGVNRRTVQRMLLDLDALPDTPVRVQRTPRMQRSGRGRTSDAYQLVLAGTDQSDTSVAVETPDQRDKNVAKVPHDQSDKPKRPKRQPVHDQGDTAMSQDPGSYPGSVDPGSSSASDPSAAHLLKLHYVHELKRHRQTPAVFKKWSRAMKAFAELADLVGLDAAKRVVTNALEDKFTHRIQPWELVDDANKHMVPHGKRNGAPTPKQPNGGTWKPRIVSGE